MTPHDHEPPVARPEQEDESFAKGQSQPHDEDVEPNFARGLTETDPDEHGRFSRGQEELPEDLPEKNVERRFSEGIERSPTSS